MGAKPVDGSKITAANQVPFQLQIELIFDPNW